MGREGALKDYRTLEKATKFIDSTNFGWILSNESGTMWVVRLYLKMTKHNT